MEWQCRIKGPASTFTPVNLFDVRLETGQIAELKSAGTIGETYKGYVDFVKDGDDDAKQLVQDENSDRESLYKLIAKRTDTTAEKVAERNAKRNFEKL